MKEKSITPPFKNEYFTREEALAIVNQSSKIPETAFERSFLAFARNDTRCL
ncbi:hypothetical protein ABIE26_002476 [Pedobacter africanus]|uniref:Uncharacterized protein n=1 Tax=Pedobacter africanus TaxID=151894 RepID=A0ACC6KXQ1_9SPHI|nr:hypothetical protein [Pedobacter africanus]MDR6784135.1 hypothetical protein [Pedobacter africanus]